MNKDDRAGRDVYLDPLRQRDACGVGFIADLKGVKTHKIVRQGIEILENLEHRGAVGAEVNSGDGAGIIIQKPDEFFRKECGQIGIDLPEDERYGVGFIFFPQDADSREKVKAIFIKCVEELGQKILGFRDVPTNNSQIGGMVKGVEPNMAQVFIEQGDDIADPDAFERRLYVIRKYAKRKIKASGIKDFESFYVASLSYKTVCYKGMLTSPQVFDYFPDLSDESLKSALALVHSRFSTNTLPSWPLAQPFRFLAHNGEINTLRGNVNWMRAREALFESDLFTDDEIQKLLPIIDDTQSDSAIIDNAVELLHMSGRSLPHVMMMLIPEAWTDDPEMGENRKAFYEYHATLMEPWDGPASIAFTDGRLIGATLDRNGLRPSRYLLTDDNILVMGSETGTLEFPPESIVLKGRLQPGRMFVASLDEGRIIPDEEIKEQISKERPYGQWINEGKLTLDELDKAQSPHQPDHETLLHRQACFGYTKEDLKIILEPMANEGKEPIGSMGADNPLAVLSEKPQNLSNYFYQLFAQVTNPPIDSIREESVMSLVAMVGPQENILAESSDHCRMIELPQPILANDDLERLKKCAKKGFTTKLIPTVFNPVPGEGNLEKAIEELCASASKAVEGGANIIVISDRDAGPKKAPIPSLLATSAVHHHLILCGTRAKCGIIVETGEAREVHDFALLLGFGASAVNPYLAFETIEDLRLGENLLKGITEEKARDNYIKAIGKGLLKIMSKMGISTVQSYCGGQIFEAVGLGEEFVEKYFTGVPSKIGGIGIDIVERETLIRHHYAYTDELAAKGVRLSEGGLYQWRARGERHTHNPETIEILQRSTRLGDYELFKQFGLYVHDNPEDANTIRGMLDFTDSDPIPIEEVEPVEEIVKRFFTGAMSFGSISKEAHETMAIAMNRLGAKSNSGEGGEDPERFKIGFDGDSRRSAIKQVASGRFGVTSNYLANADEIQIKMAQGAKPGEGGHLPGKKVDKIIAGVRHSTPGVGLISPPPHHDIYSIEDLAQLIFDLKNANNRARINVKLVSEVGVGTIASGVSKGHSEAVLISGHDGGTGASPQSSIKHAGLPWELGLSETHHSLMKNNLRSRIVVQTDGRILTGRDVAIATLLGAEEWGAATAALVVIGCVMMRKCHMNSCPVGIATQDPELRKSFTGDPKHIENYFTFLSTEMREIMASLGFRTVNEMVGKTDRLKQRENIEHWKAKHLKIGNILHVAKSLGCESYCCEKQDFGLEKALDNKLIELAQPALENGEKVRADIRIRNINRTAGAMLSTEISRRYGEEGLPDDTIHFKLKGSAGQSFGAFGARGLTFELEGEANDYFGKGLSGARLILYPPKESQFIPRDNVIIGNVAFYGATSGESFIRGMAGERFCVRNSGARVVVESVGDHGCEYMTGGRVVILGPIGKNFAAGMSGGIAYLFDEDGSSRNRINTGMVDLETVEDPNDIEELRSMMERQIEFAGSVLAEEIMAGFDNNLPKFIKVMPRDYKLALAEMAIEEAQTASLQN